jgi:hypothetical protein
MMLAASTGTVNDELSGAPLVSPAVYDVSQMMGVAASPL